MAGENLFDQRRSGAGQADDEHRVRRRTPARQTGDELGREQRDGAIHRAAGLAGVVGQRSAAQVVGGEVMVERRSGIADILQRLGEREVEVKAILFAKPRPPERLAHRGNVASVEPHGLEIRQAPPHLAQRGLDGNRAAIGGDAVVAAAHGLERVAIAHPDPGMAGRLRQHRLVQRQRLIELADFGERRGAQVGVAEVFGLGRHQRVEFGQRLGRAVLAVEHGRQVRARGVERGREFERAAQQVLGIAVAPDPPGEFGQHPDRGDIDRHRFEPRLEQGFGLAQPVVGQRQRGQLKFGIVGRTVDCREFGLFGFTRATQCAQDPRRQPPRVGIGRIDPGEGADRDERGGRVVGQKSPRFRQRRRPRGRTHPSAACFSSASRSSSARLFFSAEVLSWPQAASMSRPRGVRTGALIPPAKTISENCRTRSGGDVP